MNFDELSIKELRAYAKENGIKLQQLELEKPSYNYRITINKEK